MPRSRDRKSRACPDWSTVVHRDRAFEELGDSPPGVIERPQRVLPRHESNVSAFRKELYVQVGIASGNASNLLEDFAGKKRIINRAEEERCDANSREKSNRARTRVIVI